MASVQVSQILFESEVFGVKWLHFYNKIVKKDIVTNRYGVRIWPADHSRQKMKLV